MSAGINLHNDDLMINDCSAPATNMYTAQARTCSDLKSSSPCLDDRCTTSNIFIVLAEDVLRFDYSCVVS